MTETSFVKDIFDIIKSMVLAGKVIDQYEAGLRLGFGVVMTKRLGDRTIKLRERILTEIYDDNMLDVSVKKNQLEKILTVERAVMIEKGKLLKDKPGVEKKPYKSGRASFKTYWPFYKPDYGRDFKKTWFTGRASHIDRYSKVLPAGLWFLVPEFWFGLMRVATMPINIQTMEIEKMNVPVSDEDPSKGSILVGANLTYIVLDVEKAYLAPLQYKSYLHTQARMHMSEVLRNYSYAFWRSSSKVSADFAKEIDKNLASGLVKGLFKESDGVWTHNENIVSSTPKKSIDDLLDKKEFYKSSSDQTNGDLYRSNSLILSVQMKRTLNYEMKNYGIMIPSFGLIETVPTIPSRLVHSGYVVPSELSISSTVQNREADKEFD